MAEGEGEVIKNDYVYCDQCGGSVQQGEGTLIADTVLCPICRALLRKAVGRMPEQPPGAPDEHPTKLCPSYQIATVFAYLNGMAAMIVAIVIVAIVARGFKDPTPTIAIPVLLGVFVGLLINQMFLAVARGLLRAFPP